MSSNDKETIMRHIKSFESIAGTKQGTEIKDQLLQLRSKGYVDDGEIQKCEEKLKSLKRGLNNT
ncbi:hypothetical protein [Mechercharimyces sp. CAU 1602]|uniref:hypothetical protein n=1 Tax=Mechercharimyces sp. CAU 1602 TaxID=2973933 RepID=UPI002162B007|nr:hypothetical protein [Mechercharimyces sp. CAU 1602]MCS1351659.1 hypothetical protein [Mechercharimyces sp. CAU 1602]